MTFMWREKSEAGKRKSHLLPLVSIVAAGMICYLPVLCNGFLRYDDYGLLVNNPLVKDPSWRGLGRILSEFYASNYQPVVLILLRVLYALFGLNELVFHLVPLLFHAANSCLLYLILNQVGVSRRIAVICTLLFSLHPLRVEAVAWVYAGFSYTISAFFFLAAVLSYLEGLAQVGKANVRWQTLALFGMAVLSKPVAIVLPFALCAIDFLLKRPMNISRLKEKWLLLGQGAMLLLIATWAQHAGGATSVSGDFGTWERLVIPLKAMAFYVSKTLWPFGLTVLVPYPTHDNLFSTGSYGSLLVLLIPWMVWFLAVDRRRSILFGVVWYLVCIFPVLRLIPIGHSLVGDRYSYLPSIGLSIGLGFILTGISNAKIRGATVVSLGVCIVLLATLSRQQAQIWKDDVSLWKHAVSVTPDSILAHTHLGSAFSMAGRLGEAHKEFRMVQRWAPDLPNGDFGLGKLYGQRGEFEQSIKHFERVIRLDPDHNEAYTWLGVSFCGLKQWEKAYQSFQKARRLGGKVPMRFYREASRRLNEL